MSTQSPLSFNSTQLFRQKLLIRNLAPYNDDGFKPTTQPGTTEFSVNDQAVIDSTEVEVIGQVESKDAYILNEFGPNGGFGLPISVEDVITQNGVSLVGKAPYYNFIASNYSGINILTNIDPLGNNGRLSQDSDLARIAAQSLKTEFEYRVAQETYQQTIGRVNLLDALTDPYDLLGIVTGRNSIIERDWKISVPKSIIGKGLDFISRVSGVYSPYSWIPGDYFSQVERPNLINQAINAVTGIFDTRGVLKLDPSRSAMEIFLDNTGSGQRSRLFKGLSLNRYVPDYNKNFLTDLFTEVPKQNYYVGSSKQELRDIVSPQNSLPLDQDGNKTQTPVYGYGDVAQVYENENKNNEFKFGLNQISTYDSGGIQGGFTWVSPKYKDNAGKKVGRGGEFFGNFSSDWSGGGIKNTFENGQSVGGSGSYDFTKGSILDNTQKLIEAADSVVGIRKTQHVGNAIDQVSKVFHDGTRELTKGSRVIAYKDINGQIVGQEYCRVFTKDTPYFSMSDLQKTEGITNNNRKFTHSVLDNPYNLNIAPICGDESTNLTGNDFDSEGVKKYMFSLENLAWRTSNKKGFTYQDLPHSERGPNGGRIMWFPPYDIKVSEQNSVQWSTNNFLGRPEPVYSYNNTTRTGTLSWKIIVDHPSILNAIVDKELSKEGDNNRVNQIVDSFFAGCRKYDIYELATKFPQFTYQDIYEIITKSEDTELVLEQFKNETPQIPTETDPDVGGYTPKIDIRELNFFFDNDIPGKNPSPTADTPYGQALTNYLNRRPTYNEYSENSANFMDSEIQPIIQNVEKLTKQMNEALTNGASLSIIFDGSASAPQTEEYNKLLSQRRIDSVMKYLLPMKGGGEKTFQEWKDQGKITYTTTPKGEIASYGDVNCNTIATTGNDAIFPVAAMKCRRVRMSIIEKPPQPEEVVESDVDEVIPVTSNEEQPPTKINVTKTSETTVQKEEVAKIIVRKLLNECDYFNLVKEDSPMVYDGIKEKIKYFQPAFHSMTPEGLNSRLTFLQQCIRPGDTIPVINDEGKPTEFNAKNTSFGSPPICVLRIGDFYHTKIAINQLTISYDPLILDMNPEGIGVQPMIADVSITFYFIGGQGLKEPVNRLQNALSFNFYANTEVYDERSVITETRSELNNNIWKEIEENITFDENQNIINNSILNNAIEDIGSPIGEPKTNVSITYPGSSATTVSGQTSYMSIMSETIDLTKNYVDTIVNGFSEIINRYSIDGIGFLGDKNNQYVNGELGGYFPDGYSGTSVGTKLFGKTKENVLQDKIDFIFNDVINRVNDGSSPLLSKIDKKNFTSTAIDRYKYNIKNVVNEIKSTFISDYISIINQTSDSQLELIRNIDKINFILTKTDGYRSNNKNIQISITAATEIDKTSKNVNNTYEEMIADIKVLGKNMSDFYDEIFDEDNDLIKGEVKSGGTYSILSDEGDGVVTLMNVMYNKVLTSKDVLIEQLLGDTNSNDSKWVKYVENIIDDLYKDYTDVKEDSEKIIRKFKKKKSVKVFDDYSPFVKEKNRIFEYTQLPQDFNNSIKNGYFNKLYSDENTGGPKFNGKIKFE